MVAAVGLPERGVNCTRGNGNDDSALVVILDSGQGGVCEALLEIIRIVRVCHGCLYPYR
jgi:hypothetical protein